MRSACLRVFVVTGLALATTACGLMPPPEPEPASGLISISFADVEAPGVLDRQATATREPDTAPAGDWALLSGLRRAERATVRNADNGKSVTVALYRSDRRLAATQVRLSPSAAEAIGLTEGTMRVRITALRSEPVLETRR